MNSKPKVITIVGPTASGKTTLSIEIAKQFNGEVISADSRQVYKGMDIGTGKVTQAEMGNIPHHLLDIADPTEVYTGADFKRDATVALDDIVKRDRLPIIAGGTFFYIELLRNHLQSAPVPPNPALREALEKLTTETLFQTLQEKDSVRAAAIDKHNRRRLIRALEIIDTLGTVPPTTEAESSYDWLLIGIDISKEQLHQNIHTRLHTRLENGMIEEVVELHKNGVTYERLDSFGLEYRYIARYLQNQITHEEMVTEIENKSRQYAKRQMSWLKRDKSVEWVKPESIESIFQLITTFNK